MISRLLSFFRKSERPVDKALDGAEATLSAGPLIDEYHDLRVNRTIISVGLAGMISFMVLISLTPVHEVATGSGEILPEGFVQSVGHLEGGRVSEIFKSEGDYVHKGDPIIALDPVTTRAELQKAKSRLAAVDDELSRQKWGVSEKGLTFTAGLALRGAMAAVPVSITPTAADDNYRQAQLDVVAASINADEASAARVLELKRKEQEKLVLAKERLDDFEVAYQQGAVSKRERDLAKSDKLDSERNILQLEAQHLDLLSQISASRAKYHELRAEFQQAAASGIAEKEAEQKELLATVTQLENRLENLTIRAPSDGIINRLSAKNAGQVIAPGGLVVEMVPDSGKFFAEVEVPGDRIGFIAPGMPARIKVLAYDYTRFGEIDATVSDVSATSMRNESNGSIYYRVRLSIDRDHMGNTNAHMPLAPGMPVVTDIVLEKKSVLSYLLKPLRAISDRAFTEQ